MTLKKIPLARAQAGSIFLCLLLCGLASATTPTAYKVSQLAVSGATATYGDAINKNSVVVGVYTTSTATEGFSYSAGKYSTLTFPKSNKFTRGLGINDSNLIVGDFLGADGFYHGFTFSKGKYTQYDVNKGVISTSIFGVNNSGNYAGAAGGQGFVDIGGTVTQFYGSGTDLTYAYAINSSNNAVGQYFDSGSLSHCFYRDGTTGTISEIVYPGALQTACEGINDSGEITGFFVNSSNQTYGFTDIGGVFTQLDFLVANALNNSGAFVGYYFGPGATGVTSYGYIATPTTLKSLGTVAVNKAQSTSTYGVNNANVIVGQYANASGVTHGMIMSGSKVTNIDDPKGPTGTTACYGINTASEVVGYYTTSASATLGFLYSKGTFTDIGPAGAIFSEAITINDSGVIAGTYEDSSDKLHAFTYNGSTYTTIDVPGATVTEGWGINSSGEVTLLWIDSNNFWESSTYNGTTFTTINVPGALNSYAHSINKSGTIVFGWQDLYGNEHGAILSAGSYYIFDDPSGTGTRGDGINDSGLMVGRFLQNGSTTDYDGFKGTL